MADIEKWRVQPLIDNVPDEDVELLALKRTRRPVPLLTSTFRTRPLFRVDTPEGRYLNEELQWHLLEREGYIDVESTEVFPREERTEPMAEPQS